MRNSVETFNINDQVVLKAVVKEKKYWTSNAFVINQSFVKAAINQKISPSGKKVLDENMGEAITKIDKGKFLNKFSKEDHENN